MNVSSCDFSIYYGDASDGFDNTTYLSWRGEYLLDRPEFTHLTKEIFLKDLMFLHQVHSAQGQAVTSADREPHSFITSGDFLITNQPYFGIGVMTADCMPVACYDPHTQSIGIAHAGWRGLIAGVVPAMIVAMEKNYGTCATDLKWWVGPCARSCCYEVSADFVNNIPPDDQEYVMHCKDGKWFFDGVALLRRQLAKKGISDASYSVDNALCTICNQRFSSYRRSCINNEKRTSRNMTVIVLSE